MCRANTTYCCICGCPFSPLDIDPDVRGSPYSYDTDVLAAEDTEWLRRGRAVDQDTFFAGDDEYMRSLEGIDSLMRQIETIESSRQNSFIKFFRGSELDGPVYAMHNTCMSIAEHVRRFQLFRGAYPGPSPASVLQNFYVSLKRLHYRIACQSHSVRWEHGYYGAARFWRNFWGQERGWEWLCADPTSIPNLTEWVLSQLRPVSDHDPPPLKFPVDDDDDDTAPYPRPALDGMPIDVLRRIASFLPTASVLRLRRCSKPLASRIELRQSFWRDGLVAGDLVSFLWDLDGEKCRQADRASAGGTQHDWRTLARGLKAHRFVQAALRKSLARRPVEGYGIGYLDFYRAVAAQDEAFETDAPVGLLNRCRIAQVVADVEQIEEEELHDCHAPLSDEEEIYAAMWIMQVQRPEKFDEYRIRRSLELYGDLSEVLEGRPRVMCRL